MVSGPTQRGFALSQMSRRPDVTTCSEKPETDRDSALESATLLHEVGAEVEIIARQFRVRWPDQRA